MRFRRLGVGILIAVLPLSAAVSKEMQELQRDVALLQDLVKSLQLSVKEELAGLRAQVKTSADAAAQANAAVAAIQQSLAQMQKEQEQKLVLPMAGLGTRMDQTTGALNTMQQAVSDLASLMSKLQTQMSDMNAAVKVLAAPPAQPPPPADGPTISATDLLKNAEGDRRGGKLDLATQEYSDYLKWYGTTASAGDAQYWLGSIHYSQGDYETAIKDFDAVLTNYPDRKSPDALFYKGRCQLNLGKASDAAVTFQDLRKRYPGSDLAKQSLTVKKQ
jgi:tol-pal system protein YbgF